MAQIRTYRGTLEDDEEERKESVGQGMEDLYTSRPNDHVTREVWERMSCASGVPC